MVTHAVDILRIISIWFLNSLMLLTFLIEFFHSYASITRPHQPCKAAKIGLI
ncbi:hypothetical protein BDW60DRAFT_198314 [Aspergillus nidulans var. acristatus]